MKRERKIRIAYAAMLLVLIGIEVLIALFVHDNFIRPYLGDVLAVIAVYCAVRILIPFKCRLLPLYVFAFAVCVEIAQYFNFVALLGFENNTFMKILLGSSFDIKDIFCYAAGCTVLGIYEAVASKHFFMFMKKNFIAYFNSFSTKKKLAIIVSVIAFLPELFTAVCMILDYFNLDDAPIFYTRIYDFLSVPAVIGSNFLPFAIYIMLFPILYFIINITYFCKRKYGRTLIMTDFAFQLIHPATLSWSFMILHLILSMFGHGFFFRF